MARAADVIRISLPRRCLVVLSGIAASGKTTFARWHFQPTEIVGSDACRAAVCDDPHNQAASHDAFDLMYEIIARRMKFDRLCVADATHLTHESRKRLIDLCRRFNYPAYLIVLDVPSDECKVRDANRTARKVGSAVIDLHAGRFRCDVDRLRAEGFHDIWVLKAHQVNEAAILFERHGVPTTAGGTRPAEP